MLGPSGNVQGGHKFYTLNSVSEVVRQTWKVLPIPQSIIDRINVKAQGQPAHPVFTDCKGNPIGDVAIVMDHEDLIKPQQADDLPGAHIPESDESDKIPGVGSTEQDPMMPEPADVEVSVDFELVKKRQRIAMAALDDLFKVNEDAVKLKQANAKSFHSIVTMMLNVIKRARPDTALAIAFLTMRVREPDEDDWQ